MMSAADFWQYAGVFGALLAAAFDIKVAHRAALAT